MINDKYYGRRYVIAGIALVVVLVYIIRLFMLQIVDKSTLDKSYSNALVHQAIYPSRGLIYDRNGELLVFNQPIYEVTMIMREMGSDFDTLGFCQSMNMDTVAFNQRIREIKSPRNRGYSSYTPQVFLSQLGKSDIAALQESLYRYPGIGIRKRTLRDYTYNAAAHVLGSVGEVSQKDLDRDSYYSIGDYSGRDGIERMYEKALRGEKGVEVLMRDSRGRIQGSYRDGKMDRDAVAGTNLTLTLDIQLQLLAEELLDGKIGSAVAIEPATGEILAMVSNPSWDPHLLVGKARSKNYNKLLTDRTKPLMNRATQATYPPGSTFKTVQALVCLKEGGITENTLFPCNGPGSAPIKCTHHHGSPVALLKALEQSCNPYFWHAFRSMLEKDGYGKKNVDFVKRYDLWRKDVMQFGLGARFADTDLSEQSSGNVPSVDYYNRCYGKGGWRAITIRSNSIGQGEILETPLQMANQAACIANGGYYITPHLNKADSMLEHRHKVDIDAAYFDMVKQGMHMVMTNGTGRHYNIDSLQMCGKTGTAQNSHGKDHAICVGFAPMDSPKIAVAVVVENSGFGATWAAPVASMMMEKYLTGDMKRKDLHDRIADAHLNQNVEKRNKK